MPPPERPLDPSYRIETLAESGIDADGLVEFWRAEGDLEENEGRRRVGQVLLVATSVESGSLAGVCTAVPEPFRRLGMTLWYYRVLVSGEARRSYLAFNLLRAGAELLEQRFVSGEDRRASGVLLEVENEDLMLVKRGRWRSTDFTFVGVTPRGRHLRVRYFPDALAPLSSGA